MVVGRFRLLRQLGPKGSTVVQIWETSPDRSKSASK